MVVSQRDAGSEAEDRPIGWSLLLQRNFATYWTSGLISNTGTWLHNVTATVVMFELTGSAIMVGLVNAAAFLPILLFGLPAGGLSDRLDRHLIVMVAQGLAMLVAVGLFLIVLSDRLTPAILVVSCFLIGSGYAVAKPALAAMLPALVGRANLVDGTAFNLLQFNLGQIAGPALSTLILLIGTPTWAFGLNSATFAVQIFAMQVLGAAVGKCETPERAAMVERSPGALAGVRFIRRTPPMAYLLMIVALCNAPVEALRTLAPIVAANLLGERPAIAGIIVTAYGCGSLAALLAFSRVRRRVRTEGMLAGSFGLQALGAAGIALSETVWFAIVAAVPLGLGFSFAVPILNSSLQQLTSDAFRGRVMASFSMAHLGSRPLFSAIAGGAAALAGARSALLLFALVAGAALIYLRLQRLTSPPEGAQ